MFLSNFKQNSVPSLVNASSWATLPVVDATACALLRRTISLTQEMLYLMKTSLITPCMKSPPLQSTILPFPSLPVFLTTPPPLVRNRITLLMQSHFWLLMLPTLLMTLCHLPQLLQHPPLVLLFVQT